MWFDDEEEENNETNNNDDGIYNNEELVFNCINSAKVNGIAELLQHFNNIPIEHLTSPSFINKLEHSLKDDNSIGFSIPLCNLIRNNYPSNSLILLEYLKDKGINVKQLIYSPQIYISVLNSSLLLCDKVIDKIMLKNKLEEKAQLELVKIIIDLSFEYFKGNEEEIMRNALGSLNLKIIKYFVSLNIFDIKQSLIGRNGLHIALLPNIHEICEDSLDKEQQNSLLKLIKYLVDQGVDIHQRNSSNGETILHLAAKNHSLKMIKYLVSLSIDIHSLDNQKNTVLLSTFNAYFQRFFINDDLEYYKRFEKVIKYFISIGINIDHQNKYGMDAFLCSIESCNFELIKYIGSLMPSLKSPDRYDIKSESFQKEISNLLKCFNIEMIKYLDEFPCFTNYFDGENKTKTKNSILFRLVVLFIKSNKMENNFEKFKEVFQFFLNKRNNINSIDNFNQNLIQHNFYNEYISWKFWDYVIEKGINLHHLSNNGSILHYTLDRDKRKQDYCKYIMIRSMEINSQIVDHPKFKDLKDEDRFEDFFRKDEEEENEEKVINWKRGMAEILMNPSILNLFVAPRFSFTKFTYDEKSSKFNFQDG